MSAASMKRKPKSFRKPQRRELLAEKLLISLSRASGSENIFSLACEESIKSLCDWSVGILFDEDNTARISCATHRSPKLKRIAQELKHKAPDARLPAGPARACHGKQIRIMTGTLKVMDFGTEPLLALGYASSLIIPLGRGPDRLGCLILFRSKGPAFTALDVRQAEIIQKCLELALLQSRCQEKTAHALEARNDFLMVASHEFETPLTSLKLDLELLRRWLEKTQASDSKKVFELLSRLDRQTTRMTQLIDDTINYSLAATGTLVLTPETLTLNELLRESLERVSSLKPDQPIPITLHMEQEIHGRWDRARIEEVIFHLVLNALKYGQGKPISINLRLAEKDLAELRISDLGPGIPKGQKEKVFAPFGRMSSSRHYGGLGLGLHLVREIVRLHGGRIDTLERAEGGTEVIVQLPTDLRLDIDAILAAHLRWVQRIRNYVHGRSAEVLSVSLVSSDVACSLGDWILRELERQSKGEGPILSILKELRAQHRNFHDEAAKLVGIFQTQGREPAEALLAQNKPFSRASSQVNRLLQQLRKRLKQPANRTSS